MNTYTCKLTSDEGEILKKLLLTKEFSFSEKPYTKWHSSAKNISITLYASDKLVIQGKETENFVLFTLEPEILKKASLGYETLLNNNEEELFTPHIGIDESGKGDFFGPLVIAAAYVSEETREQLVKIGIKDSKQISGDKKLLSIASEASRILGRFYSVVTIGNKAYNSLYAKIGNLNKLLAWGHARALENLLEKNIECSYAISDQFGNKSLIENALMKKGKQIKLIQRTKAESDIAVAAASVIARAEFLTKLDACSQEVKYTLPKGAGPHIKITAKKIIENAGIETLNNISKTHFKTYNEVIS